MKKVLIVLMAVVGISFASKAQFSGNLQYTRSSGVNVVGTHFNYFFGSEGLKIAPMVGVSKALISGSSLSIDYGVLGRYYLNGDTDPSGLYPELAILGARNNGNSWALGLGAGFTTDTGVDLGFRWETGINPSGGSSLTFKVGVFF